MLKNHGYRSDKELIAAHINGDIPAWEILLERYQIFIYRVILRNQLQHSDAEDIFQNVCLKFYMHLDDLRDVNRLASWLGAVITQEVALWRRRTAMAIQTVSLESTIISELPRQEPLPDEVLIAEERIRFVHLGLKQLGEPCNHLLSLLYRPEPLSYSNIAQILSIPLGSIGPRRARCLERLKNILSDMGY